MTDLIPFTNRPDCPKCGNQSFDWHWFGNVEEAETNVQLTILAAGAIVQQEHLRLKCLLCGWAFAMQPKDATNA